jgi:hypothetical protein
MLAASACTDASSPPTPAPPAEEVAAPVSDVAAEHEGEELAPYMAALQRYVEKLYLAGSSEHWELAHFYEHELAEVALEITGGGFEEDGHDVSALTRTMLLPALADVEAALETQSADGFDLSYRALLESCNTCHDATDHGFIRLQVPDANAYPSQDFTP